MHQMVERVICTPLNAIEHVCHLTIRRWPISVSWGGGEAGEQYEKKKTLHDSEQASSRLMGDDDKDTDSHPGVVCLIPMLAFHRVLEKS
jgi:hypothetical protein